MPPICPAGATPRILAFDCGMKYNIIRYLARKGVELTVVPFDYDIDANGGIEQARADVLRCFARQWRRLTQLLAWQHVSGTRLTLSYCAYLLSSCVVLQWDGVFISNGPGDPSMCSATIAQLRKLIAPAIEARLAAGASGNTSAAAAAAAAASRKRVTPVFGICLGNQLLSLAAGASTYKMKYGNRGMNQPVVDLRTTRCYISPQNHGFAVDPATLPGDWKPFFINANDGSNEGIIHTYLPFFSVQFHPEANGGPLDTEFLFDMFMAQVRSAEL